MRKFSVDFDQTSSEEHADLWSDAVRPLFFVSPIRGHRSHVATLGKSWLLDRIVFCEAMFGAQVAHRTKRHLSAGVADALVVQTYRYGQNWGEIDGVPIQIGVGEVNVMDYSRAHVSRSRPTHVRSLVIAHDLVGYDPAIHPPTIRFGTETVIGYVLHETIAAIFEKLDYISRAEAPIVANGLIGLLRSVLLSDASLTATTPDFTIARNRAIRSYVNQQIKSERVSVENICAKFNVSRATLYRDFKEEGGVERFILGRRLEAALTTLAFGSKQRGAVSRTAEQLGFSSTTHFSREFKRRFRFTPTEVLGTGRIGRSPKEGGTEDQENRHGDALESFLREL